MLKRLSFALLAAIIFVGALLLIDIGPRVEAGHTANVIGWAWGADCINDNGDSDCVDSGEALGGIGWISFSCENRSSCRDDGGDSDYGVYADKATGEFSGYAWSSNYGWINFDPAGPYPAGNCSQATEAQLKDNGDGTHDVVGWARVVSAPEGGWDGWVCMSGAIPATGGSYGGTLGTNDIFRGWSWGGGGKDGVVGWVKWDPWPGDEVRLKSNYSLTVEKPGNGEGTVTSVLDGDEDNDGVQDINCGNDCFEDYSSQTTVQLNADWQPGTIFEGWFTETGQPYPGCEDPIQNCVVNVDGAETVVARFRKTACNDGLDNDADGEIDLADPGCADINDDSEENAPPPQCNNGFDDPDPEDLLADQDDPGCHTDGDPNNPGSYNPNDNDETDSSPPPPPPPSGCPGGADCPACNDGIDNDNDAKIDYAGCHGQNINGVNQCTGDPADPWFPADPFCNGNPDGTRESFNQDYIEV